MEPASPDPARGHIVPAAAVGPRVDPELVEATPDGGAPEDREGTAGLAPDAAPEDAAPELPAWIHEPVAIAAAAVSAAARGVRAVLAGIEDALGALRSIGHQAPTNTARVGEAQGADARALVGMIADVRGADGVRFGAVDDLGGSLDGLKILDDPRGGYVGLYHTQVDGSFRLRVATSDDLLTWQRVATLDDHASQGDIQRLADGSWLVAYEKDRDNWTSWVSLRHYATIDDLVAGRAIREFDTPQTLGTRNEGTPSIRSVQLGPDGRPVRIELGMHYFRDGHVDRQATGVLTGFQDWSARAEPRLAVALERIGMQGNFGDRDHAAGGLDVYEYQLRRGDWASWRIAVHDQSSDVITPVDIDTPGGSTGFGNPGISRVTLPDGSPGLAITSFVFSEGAAPGEAGSLVYYHRLSDR